MRSDRIAGRGSMRSVDLTPEGRVEFQYNPAQLTDKRTVQYATVNAPGQLMPQRHYTQGGDRTITFTAHVDGLFDGPSVPIAKDSGGSILPELNKYRAFMYPQTPTWQDAGFTFVGLYQGAQPFVAPPRCQFVFGARGRTQVVECVVTELSIQETLFDDALAPLRAEVSITLSEVVP